MKNIIAILLLAVSHPALSQNFDPVKGLNSISLGAFSGVANTMSRNATSPTLVNIHSTIEVGSISVNVVLIASDFKGWKNKTKKQRRRTIINGIGYIALGGVARHAAIHYSQKLTFNR